MRCPLPDSHGCSSSTFATACLLPIWLLLVVAPAAEAVETTYNGVTVTWDAGLSDVTLWYQSIAGSFYETAQFSPYGNHLRVTVRLPAAFAQSTTACIGVYSRSGGGVLASACQTQQFDAEGQPLPWADLVLDTEVYVNVSLGGSGFKIDIAYNLGPWPSSNTDYFSIAIRRADSAVNTDLRLKGGPDDNPETEFDDDDSADEQNCEVGLPTYTVNTSTLNLIVQDTEFRVNGLGPAMATTHTWNTAPIAGGMFGNGWTSPYESTIQTYSRFCDGAYVLSGTGQGTTYTGNICTEQKPVTMVPPTGVYDRLQAMPGYWLLDKKDSRETYRYDRCDVVVVPGPPRPAACRLTSIADQNGNTLTLAYNLDDTIKSVTDAAGRVATFAYNSDRHCTSIAYPNGLSATFAYDLRGNLVETVDLYGTTIAYQYDADNAMTAISYAGKTTRFTYDTSGGWKHLATLTNANGHVRRYSGLVRRSTITDARGGTTVYSSDSNGMTIGITDPVGNTSVTTYAAGLPVSVRDPKFNIVTRDFDTRGNMTKLTDRLGNATTHTYDAKDDLVTTTNALTETVTYAYDAHRNLTSVSSPRGAVTTFTYDRKGQLTGTTDANGHTAALTYDAFGNVKTATDAVGKTTIFGYDSTGINLTSVTDPNGHATILAYDQNRRPTRITHADGTYRVITHDACAITALTDENGHTTTYARDQLLQVIERRDALGAASTKTYDKNGNLTAVTDALVRTTSLTYDAADRPTRVTNPLGLSVAATFDVNGNVTGLEDERVNSTMLVYDANDRLVSWIDALNGTATHTRDALGRIRQTTNVRGGTIDVTYDADGRLTARRHDRTTVATYVYDNAGRLTSVTDGVGVTSYLYTARNQVAGITYRDGKTVAFAYDSAGNLTGTTYPGGTVVTYGFSDRNRVQSVRWGTNTVSLTHDAAGNLLTENRSNGMITECLYDANNRMIKNEHTRGATTIAGTHYTRDAVGQVTSENVTLPVPLVLRSKTETGSYDAVNQVRWFGASSYMYDNDGNVTDITQGGSWLGAYAYDPENRLVRATTGEGQTDYAYDGLGNRVSATRGGSRTQYYYDHLGRLLFEADGGGTIVNYYVYDGRRLTAMKTAAGATYFYHFDKNGSTVAMTDERGVAVNAYAYLPYGETAGSRETVPNHFTYVGAYGVMDEGHGLYFMKHRYYDAATGRFLQRDPIGFQGGMNLYAYAGGNPVDYIDPEGLSQQLPKVVAVANVMIGFGGAAFGGPVGWAFGVPRIFAGFKGMVTDTDDDNPVVGAAGDLGDPTGFIRGLLSDVFSEPAADERREMKELMHGKGGVLCKDKPELQAYDMIEEDRRHKNVEQASANRTFSQKVWAIFGY